MAASLDEATLQRVADDGEMQYNKWPPLVEPLLERLSHIAFNEFAMPRPYSIVNQQIQSQSPTQKQSDLSQSQHFPRQPTTPIRNLPPVPPFPTSSATSTSNIPDSLPPSQPGGSDLLNDLPEPLSQLLNGIVRTIKYSFADRPPHTIQRLAELILYPTKYYRTLPAWLRAVDRTVSVSSTADIFPLSDGPPMVNGIAGEGAGGILWTNQDSRNNFDNSSLGSDESLGGALLTPIPWLRNGLVSSTDSSDESGDGGPDSNGEGILGDRLELPLQASMIQGSNDPLVPERENGAVTQGELIRMEQEAGVVTVSREEENTIMRTMAGFEDDVDLDDEDLELVPHARGPDVVGSVDLGKVNGKDVSVRLGSPPSSPSSSEHRSRIDPNNAQDVLSSTTPTRESGVSGSMSDDFELVHKDDEMQIDTDIDLGGEEYHRSEDMPDQLQQQRQHLLQEQQSQQAQDNEAKTAPVTEDDGDIVLVDADGKIDEDETLLHVQAQTDSQLHRPTDQAGTDKVEPEAAADTRPDS